MNTAVNMRMVCLRCDQRWFEFGKWPDHCPYCASKRIRPITSSSPA